MNRQNDKRKRFFANSMHKEMFFMVFGAAAVPTVIVTISLFYLIFRITAEQAGIPETIAYTVIPAAKEVLGILAVATPIAIIIILFIAHKITHKTVGPFDRIVRELGESIDGSRKGPIVLRGKDKFQPLVDKINILLDKNKD